MFCVRILTHPAFVCDIQQTPPIGVTMDVISKVFQDSWSTELFSFNKNSFSHRQMFVNEIPRYRQVVSSFYSDIKSVTPCNREDVINEIQPLLDVNRHLVTTTNAIKLLHNILV
ncbi:plexin-B-like [Anneissia japonica]|uniref:plexin-B-like n=1 Tax=Anneissia japonica TaxID=1529436 RepID=UPI00142573D6|nr:plexin-B-like [Anneissia japonica]